MASRWPWGLYDVGWVVVVVLVVLMVCGRVCVVVADVVMWGCCYWGGYDGGVDCM